MGIDLHDYQTTIKSRVTLSGFGVHSGKPVSISFLPADPDTGVVFHHIECRRRDARNPRAGLRDRRHRPLHRARRSGRPPCRHGRACHGRAVRPRHRQCRRSRSTATKCRSSTAAPQPSSRRSTRPASRRSTSSAATSASSSRCASRAARPGPSSGPMTARASRSRSISRARRSAASPSPPTSTPTIFRRDIARARTFGFMKDVERLWAAGYALGSSLENSVVIGDDSRVINMEGLRYKNEFVRHKTARRDGRPGACRRALHRLLPLLSRRPPAERRGAAPSAVRPLRLRDRRDEPPRARPFGRDDRGQRAVYAPWML